MRWKMYWITLLAILGGVLYYKNYRAHTDKTRKWLISKTMIEGTLLVLAASFAPVLLIIFGSLAINNWIAVKFPSLQGKTAITAIIGFFAGSILMLASGFILEIPVLIGVIGIGMLSNDFLAIYYARREKRAGHEKAA